MATGIDTNALTLGPISSQVKSRAKPSQWKTIVKKAHSRGFTVESFLDQSIPEAMKARTKSSLRTEADTTVKAAYAPAEKEISLNEERTKAIDTKRARDNQYYLDWLAGKSAEINAHTEAANTLVREKVGAIQAATGQAATAMRSQIAAAVTQTPGVVSDPNQSTTLNRDVPAAGVANTEAVGNAATATEQQITSQNAKQAGYDASNFALIASMEAKRQGDTWNRLADLGDEKQKLQLTKAADTAKEVARLLDDERDKGNQNEQNRIVAQRLGVEAAGVQQRADAATAANNLGIDKLNETIRNNKAKITNSEAQQTTKNAFEQAKLEISQGKLDLGWYKAKHPNAGGKGSGAKGGPSSKSKDPQNRFEYGYALVATSKTPGKPGAGNKPGTPGKKYTSEYVTKNRKTVTNQIVAQGLTRKMADAIVHAYISMGGEDPGKYTQWLTQKSGTGNPPASEGTGLG